MSQVIIISGEASETESEDESSPTNHHIPPISTVQGAVITGEDSESENENDASVASAVSALHETGDVKESRQIINEKPESLLHQKLRESNGQFHHDLESFCETTASEATTNLSAIDHQLIKSQLSLQGAVTSLKSLTVNSLAIKTKLQSLLSAHFIPNISTTK